MKENECTLCDDKFPEHWTFEKHLQEHGRMKEFSCEHCDKTFYTEWQLGKHEESQGKNLKFCHYYNNSKKCPYEDFGCKFKNKESPSCSFKGR